MSSMYYKLPAEKVYEEAAKIREPYETNVGGVALWIHPHVYPSERFRTTEFVLQSIQNKLKGRAVCDMGCGPGIVGLFALYHGAKHVVQVDINPHAVANAKDNIEKHCFNAKAKIFESNCFEHVPRQTFDIIIWNMPFHDDEITVSDPLERAFYDPKFESIKKFLSQLPDYSTEQTEILISFSSKGNCEVLQSIFEAYGYKWTIWKVTNQSQEYDNRIYTLRY